MESNATLTLNTESRRQLARVYLFLVSLNKRREQQAADRESLDSDTRTAASTEPQGDGVDE